MGEKFFRQSRSVISTPKTPTSILTTTTSTLRYNLYNNLFSEIKLRFKNVRTNCKNQKMYWWLATFLLLSEFWTAVIFHFKFQALLPYFESDDGEAEVRIELWF
jgi:hypothetical protein